MVSRYLATVFGMFKGGGYSISSGFHMFFFRFLFGFCVFFLPVPFFEVGVSTQVFFNHIFFYLILSKMNHSGKSPPCFFFWGGIRILGFNHQKNAHIGS